MCRRTLAFLLDRTVKEQPGSTGILLRLHIRSTALGQSFGRGGLYFIDFAFEQLRCFFNNFPPLPLVLKIPLVCLGLIHIPRFLCSTKQHLGSAASPVVLAAHPAARAAVLDLPFCLPAEALAPSIPLLPKDVFESRGKTAGPNPGSPGSAAVRL